MIPVGVATIFFFYLLIFLSTIFFIWVYFEYKNKGKKYEPPEKKLYRCSICAHLYIEDRDRSVTRCPRCGSLSDTSASR